MNLRFNRHPELEGKHAMLSASSHSWLRYGDDQIIERVDTQMAAMHGTRLHNVASELISLGLKQPENNQTFNSYVNDAIGFRMSPEVMIVASFNAFGTADAISFRRERPEDDRNTLRIHDLKTGVTSTKMDQLMIYAAYFCIEYSVNPNDINIELRIYQNDRIKILSPDPVDIMTIMSQTIHFDGLITKRRQELLG